MIRIPIGAADQVEMLDPGEEPVPENIGAPGQRLVEIKVPQPFHAPVMRRGGGGFAAEGRKIGEPPEAMQLRLPCRRSLQAPGRPGAMHGVGGEAEGAVEQGLAAWRLARPGRVESQRQAARHRALQGKMVERRAIEQGAQPAHHPAARAAPSPRKRRMLSA